MTVSTSPVQLLSVLGEPLRWRIVELLTDQQLCVCHLVDELDAPQSLVSHHLRVLREAGLVESERFRYWTYYALVPGALTDLAADLQALAGSEPPSVRRPCC